MNLLNKLINESINIHNTDECAFIIWYLRERPNLKYADSLERMNKYFAGSASQDKDTIICKSLLEQVLRNLEIIQKYSQIQEYKDKTTYLDNIISSSEKYDKRIIRWAIIEYTNIYEVLSLDGKVGFKNYLDKQKDKLYCKKVLFETVKVVDAIDDKNNIISSLLKDRTVFDNYPYLFTRVLQIVDNKKEKTMLIELKSILEQQSEEIREKAGKEYMGSVNKEDQRKQIISYKEYALKKAKDTISDTQKQKAEIDRVNKHYDEMLSSLDERYKGNMETTKKDRLGEALRSDERLCALKKTIDDLEKLK